MRKRERKRERERERERESARAPERERAAEKKNTRDDLARGGVHQYDLLWYVSFFFGAETRGYERALLESPDFIKEPC